jgi:hypothetical protein
MLLTIGLMCSAFVCFLKFNSLWSLAYSGKHTGKLHAALWIATVLCFSGFLASLIAIFQ